MESANSNIKALATDLDGTLIPLSSANASDLVQLKSLLSQYSMKLAFVTGRHFSSVRDAIEQFDLPLPTCIICDVGTSIYDCNNGKFTRHGGFDDHLLSITHGADMDDARAAILGCSNLLDSWQLAEQEPEKQARFKLSFYADKCHLDSAADHIRKVLRNALLPFSIVSSVDPFTNVGLIDVLPAGVAKGFALTWWRTLNEYACDDIVYAGDSGNDTAAFLTGVYSVLVANMDERVSDTITSNHPNVAHVYRAAGQATSGVLEGLQHFLSRGDA